MLSLHHTNKNTMKNLTQQLENHLINFMMNDSNENTLMHEVLWGIEFHEGGSVTLESDDKLWVTGDNGRVLFSDLTEKNLVN